MSTSARGEDFDVWVLNRKKLRPFGIELKTHWGFGHEILNRAKWRAESLEAALTTRSRSKTCRSRGMALTAGFVRTGRRGPFTGASTRIAWITSSQGIRRDNALANMRLSHAG